MKFTFTCKKISLNNSVKEYAEKKISKLERYFHDFLRALPADSLKGECLLPTMVDHLLHNGELSVEVLRSEERWFGVTYREDKPIVQADLRELHEKGVYPPALG